MKHTGGKLTNVLSVSPPCAAAAVTNGLWTFRYPLFVRMGFGQLRIHRCFWRGRDFASNWIRKASTISSID
jgi:hypothetical protein